MRLGIDAGPHTLDIAVEHGIVGVPIGAQNLVEDGVDATLAPLRERGLVPCQIGAFGFNPLSSDTLRQAEQRRVLEAAIPLAAETGCPHIVVCGGNYDPSGFAAGDARNFTEAALDVVARELAPTLALAERYGQKITIEPYLKTAVGSAERYLALAEKVGSDALSITLDVASLYTYEDMWHPVDAARHTCELLAGHYGIAHIKDVALNRGFHIHIDLAPLGRGVTDWSAVLPLIASHLPPEGWLILEHVATPEEARNSLEVLLAAANEAGVVIE